MLKRLMRDLEAMTKKINTLKQDQKELHPTIAIGKMPQATDY